MWSMFSLGDLGAGGLAIAGDSSRSDRSTHRRVADLGTDADATATADPGTDADATAAADPD